MKRGCKYILTVMVVILSSFTAFADGGTNTGYTPYSKFGIGSLNRPGTAYNRSKGGAGIATRDNHYINVLNPAGLTARDSLSFMLDFNVEETSSFLRQGNISSIGNTFNINGFNMTFPIWRSSAFLLGIAPFSSVGYDFANKLDSKEYYDVIGQTGNINDAYSGTGGIYQLYFGAGVTFWKKLSLGAQFTYYFGSLDKSYTRNFTDTGYRSIYSGSRMRLKGFGLKLGIQYEHPIGNDRLVVGGTYRIPTKILGDAEDMTYAIQSEVADTLSYYDISVKDAGIVIPFEAGGGISYRHGSKWSLEFNYTVSDWRKSGMDKVIGFQSKGFANTLSQNFNLGFEITPNRDDVRYYMRKVSYRAGAYYNMDYCSLDGRQLNDFGVTVGMTFPVFRWLNGITVAVAFGQKGSLAGNMIRERYINVGVGFNIYDIWFVKNQYH